MRKAKRQHKAGVLLFYGAQRRNRTTDTRIFNPLLYRLSYLGKSFLDGAAYPSRTDDLLITSQLLYQLS